MEKIFIKYSMERRNEKYQKKKIKLDYRQALLDQIKAVDNNRVYIEKKKEILKEVNFNESLPIYSERQAILEAIDKNNIVTIVGPTGCGKSTQIPQYLYAAGYKNICLTVPRRIAAISLSNRITEELADSSICKYKVRYMNTVDKNTSISIMTDGILLNEIRNDMMVRKYDVILIDEVHERTTNIDLLIALLRKVVLKRSDLKLILMSATVSKIIEESFLYSLNISRNKKLKINYEPVDNLFIDLPLKIKQIIAREKDGNILVFLPDKNAIYRLFKLLDGKLKTYSVLPLHANIHKDAITRVFSDSSKKLILATNITECSITIPKIKIVIDSGLEKRKNYHGINMCSFSVDYISRASAKQRAGRTGRDIDGYVIRLYSEELFNKMIDYNEPEILQKPFTDGLLFLKSLGLTDLNRLSFINKPNLENGERELYRLGAIDKNNNITGVGQEMVKYPMTVRYSRLLLSYQDDKTLIFLIGILILNIEEPIDNYRNEISDMIAKAKSILDKIKLNRSFPQEGELKNYLNYFKINLNKIKFEENKIAKQFTGIFYDRIAIKHKDNIFTYKGMKYLISNNSIRIDRASAVSFEYIIECYGKAYLKNITYVFN